MPRSRTLLLVVIIVAAAASRLIPHPPNFSPIGAIALLSGACFGMRGVAFLVPLAAMFLSDLALGLLRNDLSLGLHRLAPVVYGSFALIVCFGFWLRARRRPLPIAAATLASSVSFFVVTNFGVWAFGTYYPKTWEGLAACYVAAIPFFRNTLLGDAVYAALLFGTLALAEKLSPTLREAPAPR
ncbi:MAG: DUF6580 family putative transport protein [Bryobacterales bacterium]|nr:hypothetical protein [Bryobacteraceae bacterium]MDW8354557.1 DUF6580 family putative transport protein [Bryobacterales bacterium]